MAVVYRARDLKHDRPVALKVLRPELARAIGADRFLREIRTTAALQHPGVVPLFDSGEAAGLIFYVMPLVEGETLRDRLARERQLPTDEVLRIVSELAAALDYAHRKGVVHRDLKPENVMIHEGRVMLADFGIARAIGAGGGSRLTETGFVLGTPQYMSPEQATGDSAIDGRSDIYALGCLAYEMLGGEPPYGGPTAQAIVARQLTEPPRPVRTIRPALPAAVDDVLLRALARSPADRFPTAAAFAQALATAAAHGNGSRPRARRRLWAGFALGTALAIGGWLWSRRGEGADPAPSIAVLPFVNTGADPGDRYFGDGLAEELIAALSRVPGLRLAPRSSSFAFQQGGLDIRTIGARLGVDQVLEGTVRRAGGRLRVNVQLTSVADGFARWTESFDRAEGDALTLEQDLAGAILARLAPTLAGSSARSVLRRGTRDPVAYDLYLQGRYYFGLRTGPGFERAGRFFEQAIERDSTFARAWAGLADSYCIQANFAIRPAREVCPRSLAAARRALALDSTLAEAHASLGFVHLFFEWDPGSAERELTRALALDPLSATAHLWLMHVRAALGDTAGALTLIRRAVELEPFSPIMNARHGTALMRAGRSDDAVVQARRTLALDTTYTEGWRSLATFLALAGRPDSALRIYQDHGAPAAWIAWAAALGGTAADARRILAGLDRDPVANRAQALVGAYAWTALGEPDSALVRYRIALQERVPDVVFSWTDPYLAGLREDPRFGRLADSAGVPRPEPAR